MKATIKLELFGDNLRQEFELYSKVIDEIMGKGCGAAIIGKAPKQVWVAEIVGIHPKYTLNRRFLNPKKDYSKANSVGSRGVFLWYILESGAYYEIKKQTSWRDTERYFCKVSNAGEIVRVEKSEVMEWLKTQSE